RTRYLMVYQAYRARTPHHPSQRASVPYKEEACRPGGGRHFSLYDMLGREPVTGMSVAHDWMPGHERVSTEETLVASVAQHSQLWVLVLPTTVPLCCSLRGGWR